VTRSTAAPRAAWDQHARCRRPARACGPEPRAGGVSPWLPKVRVWLGGPAL